MRSWFRRSQPLPPTWQRSVGLKRDADFNPPPESEPGLAERLIGYFRGHPVFVDSPPKPIFMKSERTIRNERIAEQRARERHQGAPAPSPISFIADEPRRSSDEAPPAYDFTAAQPDMDPQARAWISGYRAPEFGVRRVDTPFPSPAPSPAAAAEIEATAAALAGAGHVVIQPKAYRRDRGG